MQLFKNIHGTKLLLVKTSLILISYKQNLIIILIKFSRQSLFRKSIHPRFGIILTINGHLPGKRNQGTNPIIAFTLNIILKSLTILHCSLTRRRDNHSLSMTTKLVHNSCTEVFYNHFNTLPNIRLMQGHKPCNLFLCRTGLKLRVFLNLFVQLIIRFVRNIILQNIKDKPFLNSLSHAIDMERFTLPFGIHTTKLLQRRCLRSSRKRKDRNILLFTITFDFFRNHIFHIRSHTINIRSAQNVSNSRHILPCCRRMSFINDNGKRLFRKSFYSIHNIRKLLNRRKYNLSITLQSNS